ncbi:MAG: hypothetical protein P8M71_06110 [Pseudomonadales bacterium]|nr:hypothetical protein [Pseudomonadales bacterium]
MKILHLHIGLSKTGTSAIQSWLSLNSKRLSTRGFSYKDSSPRAAQGAITSGNGIPLYKACQSGDEEILRTLLHQFYFANNNKAIISSEFLQGLKEDELILLKKICSTDKIDLRIIAYARSVYEHLYSNYHQGVKRHGFTEPFGFYEKMDYSEHRKYIENYINVFGDAIRLLNYDYNQSNIISSFSDELELNVTGLLEMQKKINRSLSPNETGLMRELNQLHGGDFSQLFSDHLLEVNPDLTTKPDYSPKLVSRVSAEAKDNIRWVNRFLKDDQPAIESCLQAFKPACADEIPISQLINSLVEFSISQMHFDEPRKEKWIKFIYDWAVSLKAKNYNHSLRLISFLKDVDPDSYYIKERILEYDNQR